MKNKGIIISLIIILSAFVIGLTWFLYASLTGKIENRFFIGGITKSENIIFDKIYEENISNLEVISTAGDITFKSSTDDKVRIVIYGKDADNLEVTLLEDNHLKVDYSESHKFFAFGGELKNIVVYIPENYSNYIDIKANYGDIEMISLENATINIQEDCGDIVVGKVKNANIENDYGDIKIDTILNKCEIKNDCGDIKIKNLQIQEYSNIETSLGDVKIENTNEIFIDAKTDLGDLKINNNYRHSETMLKIKNDCGDIKVEN